MTLPILNKSEHATVCLPLRPSFYDILSELQTIRDMQPEPSRQLHLSGTAHQSSTQSTMQRLVAGTYDTGLTAVGFAPCLPTARLTHCPPDSLTLPMLRFP